MSLHANYAARLCGCASLAAIYLRDDIRAVPHPLSMADVILTNVTWMEGDNLAPITRAAVRVEKVLRDCRVAFSDKNRVDLEAAVRELQAACLAFADRWAEVFPPPVAAPLNVAARSAA